MNTDHQIPFRSHTPTHELTGDYDNDVQSLYTELNEACLVIEGLRTTLNDCDVLLA